MNIYTHTYFDKFKEIGGATIPSIAFQKWCQDFGVDCKVIEDLNELKENDFVFLNTPGRGSADEIVPKCNYAFMIHAEFDGNIYDVNKFLTDKLKFIITIDKDYWRFDQECIDWYPCCYPEMLIRGDEDIPKRKSGLLYAARISNKKGVNKLLALSEFYEFKRKVGNIDIYGKQSKNFKFTEKGNANIYDRNYEIGSIDYNKYKYFWDVSGKMDFKYTMKRLNLAACEAMKHGCIPIVADDTVPEFMENYCIVLGKDKLSKFDRVNYSDLIKRDLPRSQYGYYEKREVFNRILNMIFCNTGG